MGEPLSNQIDAQRPASAAPASPRYIPSIGEHKRRAREQWSADPCGSHVARDLGFGTREFFDRIEHYRYQAYATWMRDTIGFERYPGKRLLEVGCGTGTDLLQFARGGSQVVGTDLTPRSIEISRRRFQVYNLEGEFAIGDAEDLAFPDSSFDLVYSFGVIHHTPDTERAISEFHRVLRPGGRAIVMVYNRLSLNYWGAIIVRRGLIGGELLRSSPADIMSRHVEYSETGGRPLVKAYSRVEVRRMFRQFGSCQIQVRQLTREEFGPFGRLLPEPVLRWLGHHFGWNLIVNAVKASR